MNEEGALFDSGFDGRKPFPVTPETGGISLESALRDFGPAAIDDLIPRIRAIARLLDAAHAAGATHGALHPSKVIITDAATQVIAGEKSAAPFDAAQGKPYVAPEVTAGGPSSPASDQYALAAIAYEWLLGRPVSGPAVRSVEVRSMPGVDRVTLSKAFTRALSPRPQDRFASCSEFCSALVESTTPELPLLGVIEEDPIEPVVKELPVPFRAEDKPPAREVQRFGGFALILAALVGSVFGFAAGYMARPRALQTGQPQEFASTPGRAGQAGKAGRAGESEGTIAPSEKPAAQANPQPAQPARPAPPASIGRLLVRSAPSGASVSVDGVARGTTPLALRDLDVGTMTVTIARRGYLPETRKVQLSRTRPSRSLEVRLTAEPTAAAARPNTPTPIAKPGVATGTMAVDSRPAGAAVAINGKPSGTTPLTINDLAPGEYQVTMTLSGYRSVATTVRVVAGERVRAAASLTAQEQE